VRLPDRRNALLIRKNFSFLYLAKHTAFDSGIPERAIARSSYYLLQKTGISESSISGSHLEASHTSSSLQNILPSTLVSQNVRLPDRRTTCSKRQVFIRIINIRFTSRGQSHLLFTLFSFSTNHQHPVHFPRPVTPPLSISESSISGSHLEACHTSSPPKTPNHHYPVHFPRPVTPPLPQSWETASVVHPKRPESATSLVQSTQRGPI